jgi:hypothetical protein
MTDANAARLRDAGLRARLAGAIATAEAWDRESDRVRNVTDPWTRCMYASSAREAWDRVRELRAEIERCAERCGICGERPGTVYDAAFAGVCPECATVETALREEMRREREEVAF